MDIGELYAVLAEPSRAQAKIIAGQFKEIGLVNYQCVTSGADALHVTNTQKADLLLSAMCFDDMTGTDLLRRIRSQPHGNDTCFMLISSETSYAPLEAVRQLGANAILPKPFDTTQLRQALDTALDFLDTELLALSTRDIESLDVLVVDDSRMARRLIRRTLTNLGITSIREAGDGREAIPLIENEFYDLIVTDLNMPHVDGEALVDYIRNHSKQRTVPVLMVTTEGDQGKLSAVERAGVSAICDKPFEPRTVRRLIQGMVQ